MRIDVNGTQLWFDVDGSSLVPDGARMRERPTLILVHGGPGSYDHSYFKPHFAHLTDAMQVVYLDLRDHGRSARNDPDEWTFEACADDVRAFCDVLGIVRPVVLGHSMGGFVAILYGARHPDQPGGLILQSTWARFDLDRLVEGFRAAAGDEVAELARRDYGPGPDVSDVEWARVYAAFGPNILDADALARRINSPEVGEAADDQFVRLDLLDQLPRIKAPTLVSVGSLDAVTPIAAAREIVAGLTPDVARLEVLGGSGHFPWLDDPDAYFATIREFVAETASARG